MNDPIKNLFKPSTDFTKRSIPCLIGTVIGYVDDKTMLVTDGVEDFQLTLRDLPAAMQENAKSSTFTRKTISDFKNAESLVHTPRGAKIRFDDVIKDGNKATCLFIKRLTKGQNDKDSIGLTVLARALTPYGDSENAAIEVLDEASAIEVSTENDFYIAVAKALLVGAKNLESIGRRMAFIRYSPDTALLKITIGDVAVANGYRRQNEEELRATLLANKDFVNIYTHLKKNPGQHKLTVLPGAKITVPQKVCQGREYLSAIKMCNKKFKVDNEERELLGFRPMVLGITNGLVFSIKHTSGECTLNGLSEGKAIHKKREINNDGVEAAKANAMNAFDDLPMEEKKTNINQVGVSDDFKGHVNEEIPVDAYDEYASFEASGGDEMDGFLKSCNVTMGPSN